MTCVSPDFTCPYTLFPYPTLFLLFAILVDGVGSRFACLAHDHAQQRRHLCLQYIGSPVQAARSLSDRYGAPSFKCCLCPAHCIVCSSLAYLRDVSHDVALIGRIANGSGVSRARPCRPFALRAIDRSEEHTSELPSLMRISYAVFCLK